MKNKKGATIQYTLSIITVAHNRRDDVRRCLDSLLKSEFAEPFEIIVVDNASTDGTVEMIEEQFIDEVKLLKSPDNKMAAGGRNLGASIALGEYLLFVDSDNVVAPNMASLLVQGIRDLGGKAIVGPLMYYCQDPSRVWWSGADINLWTSKTSYRREQPSSPVRMKVGHIPNVFACHRSLYDKVDGFDEVYGVMFEESDFAERLRKMGNESYVIPQAITHHNVPLPDQRGKTLRAYGIENSLRAYLVGRNRLLYMRRHAGFWRWICFLLSFLPLTTLYYLVLILGERRLDIARSYMRGVAHGLFQGGFRGMVSGDRPRKVSRFADDI